MNPEEGPETDKNKLAKDVLKRIAAVFVASALGVLGAGAVVGIDVLQAAIMAGILGVASVVEKLARSFLDDGKITTEEVNQAFSHQANEISE